MTTWPRVALGEVVEFLDHRRRPITEKDRVDGPYPYYGANGQQGTVDGYIFDEPLLLLAEDGGHFDNPSRGIAYTISGRTWVNNHAHVIRTSSDLDLNYAYRALENLDVRRYVTGSTRAKLTKAGASRIEIPLPPLNEQRRIAAILNHADGLRTKRRVALAQLGELAQSIFLDMFGDQSAYPVAPLSDLADVSSGLTKGRKLRESATREVPYMAVLNVQDKALDLSTVKTIEATEAEINRYRLQYDDLLLTEGGDPDKLGRGTLWRGEISEAIHQNHIFRVRIRSVELLSATYLNWAVGSRIGKAYFLRSAKQTTGIASINSTQLKGFPVRLPPIEQQREFAERTLQVEEARTRHSVALSGLDSLFASIRASAFRGEL